jgi:hypothetical protein
MYESFYNKKLDENIVFEDLKWTPAEINCILFNNFDNNQPNTLSTF